MRKTPSAPAMRAATEILGHPYLGLLTVTRGGELIDTATGLPDLISRLLAYVEREEQAAPSSSSPLRERARAALAASAPTPGRDGRLSDSKEKLACAPNPCDSCPYRRDTPPGVWDRQEYEKLPTWDEQHAFAGIFLCHNSAANERKAACRGWLEVHGRNFGVRMAMFNSIDMTNVKEPTKIPLYDSGAEACRAGLRGVRKPARSAVKMMQKITRAKEAAAMRQHVAATQPEKP